MVRAASPGSLARATTAFLPRRVVTYFSPSKHQHHRHKRTASAAAASAPPPPTLQSMDSPPTDDGVWAGLTEWRASPLNRRWVWGKKDAVELEADPKLFGAENENKLPPGPWVVASSVTTPTDADDANAAAALPALPGTLAGCADLILRTADPATKAALSHRAYARFVRAVDAAHPLRMRIGTAAPPSAPARPARPVLVPPWEVPPPKKCKLGMEAAMIHNIAHIELNAIDLAWDTVARFSPLHERGLIPAEFFADFAHVADDESRHLGWCLQRLAELGVAYGDIPAHNVLWEGAESTAGSLAGRLAVVPIMQEARGLDAGPRLAAKLQGRGDNRSAAVVARISEEELAHVAVGVAWFRHLCRALGADPGQAFRAHIGVHAPEALRGPFNHPARFAAGLEPEWYSAGPEHRMGHEFDAGGDMVGGQVEGDDDGVDAVVGVVGVEASGAPGASGGEDGVDAARGSSAALVERLKQMLALEGLTELPLEEEGDAAGAEQAKRLRKKAEAAIYRESQTS